MMRVVIVATAVATLAAAAQARAASFFRFDRPEAGPNERVTVRTGSTPQSFATRQRVKPFQRPIRLYLVRDDAAAEVHSRLDPRLGFIGSIVPDRSGRGLLTVSVVTLPNGSRPSGQPRNVSWYGNGLLWAGLASDGVYAVSTDRVGADGSIGDKLLWMTAPPWRAPTISGGRLEAPAPSLRVLRVNRGSFSGAANPSYMTPVGVAAAGCWRVTARLGGLSLSYVVSVVVR